MPPRFCVGVACAACGITALTVMDVWAAVPVKQFTGAKTRTGAVLTAAQREKLAATMLEDVLSALAGATRLAGILVNTVDPIAAALARTIRRARGHGGRAGRPHRRRERHGPGADGGGEGARC